LIRIPKYYYDYLHYLFNTRSEQSLEAFEKEINTRYYFDILLREIIDLYFISMTSNCFHFICQNVDYSTDVSATIKVTHAITVSNLRFKELLLDSEINDHIQFSYDMRQIFDASDVSFEIVDRIYTYRRQLIPYDQYILKVTDIFDGIESI
jgi:hypothetical protein